MKTNKGIIGIGLIIAIVLGAIVIGGGAYYLGKSGSKQEVKNPENVLSNNENQNLPVVENSQQVNVANPTTPTVATGCTSSSVPSIKVLSPNGGEVYKVGDKITVKWSSCNISPSISAGGLDIVIFISNLSGSGLPNWMIGEATQNDGQELITLPTTLPDGSPLSYGKNFKISVSKNDPSAQSEGIGDSSDNLFTINSATKTISTTLPSYIGGQAGWPPVIKYSLASYVCNVGTGNTENVKTTERIIGGRKYCINVSSDGAAGTIYYTYTYTTTDTNRTDRGGTITTNFTLAFHDGQCDESTYTGIPGEYRCLAGEQDFNIDTVIASLM